MAAGVTYDCIATTTSTGTSAVIVFNSISQSYSDLVVVISGKSLTGAGYWDVQFNTDTSTSNTNYGFNRAIGFGTTTYTDRYSNFFALEPSIGSVQGTVILNIMGYSNTAFYKSTLIRCGTEDNSVELSVGVWKNTAAINTISLYANNRSTSLPAGTTYTIYGIAAA
jgi:hypothetical protein